MNRKTNAIAGIFWIYFWIVMIGVPILFIIGFRKSRAEQELKGLEPIFFWDGSTNRFQSGLMHDVQWSNKSMTVEEMKDFSKRSNVNLNVYEDEKSGMVQWLNDTARKHNRELNKKYPKASDAKESVFLPYWNHSIWLDDKELGFRSDGVVVWRVDEKD